MSTLALDQDADIMGATHEDGAETVVVVSGALQVSQLAGQAVSLNRGSVWFNLFAGVDYQSLFYDATQSDQELAGIRASAIRDALFAVDGIAGFSSPGANITFDRINEDTLVPNIPCLIISCDYSRQPAYVEPIL